MGTGLEDVGATLGLVLSALNSASDAFPPLKSVSGGLSFFVNLAHTIQSNKEDYRQILERIGDIARDLANANDLSPSTALALRVDRFRKCLEKLQSELQPLTMSRHRILHAVQHTKIIRSCNEELDRCAQDFSLWAELLLIRDVETLRRTVIEAITAVHIQVDDLSRRTAALVPAPSDYQVRASEATVLQAIAVLASRVDDSLSQAPRQVVQRPNLHLSACLGGFSVQIDASPKSCVLFA